MEKTFLLKIISKQYLFHIELEGTLISLLIKNEKIKTFTTKQL